MADGGSGTSNPNNILTDQPGQINPGSSASNGTCNGHVAVSVSPQLAWRRRARDFVRWVGARLVNRRDVWGQCRDRHRRKVGADGQPSIWWTAPRKEERGAVRLTPEVVRAHCLASHGSEGRIIGLHSTSERNSCKWGALDIDHHGEDSPSAEINWRAAQAWYEQLVADGYRPLLLDSNGAGGFHLLVLFSEPVPAKIVHEFLRRLTADYEDHGLTAPPETFPKQARLKRGQYGNYLRLPGRHHTRNHWSRVWDGSQWLEGDAAIDFMLALQGDSPELLSRSSSPSLDRRIHAYLKRLPNLAEGQGRDNKAFTFAAWLVRNMALGDAEALRWLKEWDGANGPPLGETRLREILGNAHQYGKCPYGSGRELLRIVADDGDESSGEESSTEYHLTDMGNAQRVAARHGADLRYCHPWKQWLTWDTTRWKPDDTGEPVRRVKETQAELYRTTIERLEMLGLANAGARKAQADPLTLLLKHCLGWEDARKIAATLEVLRSESGIPILHEQLDADPFLLNCLNGTLDLRTGTLRPHRREDYLTKICRVEYDPNATCPTWHRFLARIIVSGAVRDYLQRVIGYCLTGDVREQALFFFHGAGANGKSTFLTAIREVLGDYAIQAVSELLLAKKNESHPTERADLFGRRFVATIETDQGKAMAEALMKQMTGGDRIRARKMRQDFFEFDPTHKIILAANHKPVVHGTDHGNWRRIKLVPFSVTIPEAEKDTTLPDKLRAEYPGILAWAVEGCRRWLQGGLGEPEEVSRATASYQCEQDTLGRFLAECCHVHKDAREKASLLLDEYVKWSGDRLMTPAKFGLAMKARGFEPKQSNGVRYYLGLMLQRSRR